MLSVPVSKLPQLVYETKQDIEEAGLLGVIVGHVGDGEFNSRHQSGVDPADVA